MQDLSFDGFGITLPAGWSAVVDEATYSDPEQLPPLSFSREEGVGAFFASAPLMDPEDVPRADPGDLEEVALDWGARRGLDAPLYCVGESRARDGRSRRHVAVATAAYRVGDDFVALWFLSSGSALLCASYVCPWADRDVEREERDAIAASLRFA